MPKGPGGLPFRPCVGVMLVNAQGLIFAGQRKDSAVPAWQMPQGGIDDAEMPKAAADRELWEETGVTREMTQFVAKTHGWVTYDLPPELLGKVWGGKFGGQRQKWFLFHFTGTDEQINIATEHPEFESWRWISAEEMIASIVPFKRAVYEEVVRSFRAYLA